MNAIDSLVKQYKTKVLANIDNETIKNNIESWISKNMEGIIDSVVNNPMNIVQHINSFDTLLRTLHASIEEKKAQAPLMSFSSFIETSKDYNEGSDIMTFDRAEVEPEKIKSKEEQLTDDIEKAGNVPEEPELVEEDDDESESGLTANMKELETAAIKHSNFDWYRFTGARRKRYKYGKSEWTLNPNSLVGISKACDFRNKHSLCIPEQSKTHTIDITKHNADLLKKKCKPFTGNIAAITTPTPGTRRVATASLSKIMADIENDYKVEEKQNGFEFTPITVDKGIAKDEMIKYLSNLFKVEPLDSNDEQTHWETDDEEVILKYQPDFKYVVNTRRK